MTLDVLACATTYEPTADQIARTVAQLRTLGRQAAVFDNSETPALRSAVRAACESNRVAYLSAGTNVGTAGALNSFVLAALASGVEWLLYLDQDSEVSADYSERLASSIVAANAYGQVALVGSRLVTKLASDRPPEGGRFRFTRYMIASGTAMNVAALASVDGFDESMKLDVVDHEICLRLRVHGWRLMIDTSRTLNHEIGTDGQSVVSNLEVAKHPLWRRRLMWRNSVVLCRRYWLQRPAEVARHLVARVMETVSGAFVYRDLHYITSAYLGLREGFGSASRPGLGSRRSAAHA